MTRVLLVATMYPRDAAGYRGVFIRNMVYALARVPEIQLYVWTPPGEIPPNTSFVPTPKEAAWLAMLVSRGGISHLIRSGGIRALLAPVGLLRRLWSGYRRNHDIDLYHINWLQCAIPLPNNRKPALVTVLGNDMKLLRLPLVRQTLRHVMRHRKVALCPNAEWMVQPLETAFGDVAIIRSVSFGIDPKWYAVDRSPDCGHHPQWLVVSRLTRAKLGSLFEWSEPLFADSQRELHLFGPMEQTVQIPPWVKYHGPASPESLVQRWFPAACGLITLSQHAEGRPQVMLEAMAAGLPIVASRMPAHATIVAHGSTGFLCDTVAEYGEAIAKLEEQSTNRQFGENARRMARTRMGTWDDCAQRYQTIYRDLLDIEDEP